jgi:hypothetical protein
MGVVTNILGDPEEARPLLETSLALYRALGDQWMTSRLLNCLADCLHKIGDYGAAQQLAEENLALRRALDDNYGIATTLPVLGLIAREQLELGEAERFLRDSIAILRQGGYGEGPSIDKLNELCETLVRRGRFSETTAVAREALIQA